MKTSSSRDVVWDWFFNRALLPFRFLYHWLSTIVVGSFYRFGYDLKVYGRENIPKGCFIVAPNHESHLDPPLIGIAFSRRPLRYFAKHELFELNPIFTWLIRSQGAVPISPNPRDLKRFFRWIGYFQRTNQPFVIFPEGERTPTGELLPPRPGLGFVVQATGLPVVPVFIEGTFEALPRGAVRLSPSKITVVIGKPLDFTEFQGKGKRLDKDLAQEIGQRVMDEISRLKRWLETEHPERIVRRESSG